MPWVAVLVAFGCVRADDGAVGLWDAAGLEVATETSHLADAASAPADGLGGDPESAAGPADHDTDAPGDVVESDAAEPSDVEADASGPADMAATADGDGDTLGGTDAAQGPAGTWDDPIPVGVWPFVHVGDTSLAPDSAVDSYGCAPTTNESGGEVVYLVDLDAPARLTVTVDDLLGDGVDVDVHLLAAPDPEACIARANVSLTATVSAGPVWVVVDTWTTAGGVPQAGPFTLSIDREGAATCAASGVVCPAEPPVPDTLAPEPAGLGGCPAGMARVETFCVDRWEAAVVDAETGTPLSPYAHPTSAIRAVSIPGVVPQAYISGTQAAAACAAAGKRLCTDAEWLRACKGPKSNSFPYGPAAWPGFCNDARACHPAVQTFGTTESWIWSSLGDPCIAQQPWGLAVTGAYSACASAEGLYDLVGNLHEWTADPAGTFRGGFYVDTVINGSGCAYVTTAHDVNHWDYSTGFRCCAE